MNRFFYVIFALSAIHIVPIFSEFALFEILRSNNAFSAKIFQMLLHTEKEEKNILISPASLHALLSLIYLGSAGDTKKELRAALGVLLPIQTAVAYKSLLKTITNIKGARIMIANKIYASTEIKLVDEFKCTAGAYYMAELATIDFHDRLLALNTINNWIGKKTKHKITKLLTAKDLDIPPRIILVSTLYFKASWLYPFEKVSQKEFYISDTETVPCQMMTLKSNFQYSENEELDAAILRLFYSTEDVSMVIILPNSRTGADEMKYELDKIQFRELIKGLKEEEVEVFLPKFNIEMDVDFKKSMEEHTLWTGLQALFRRNVEVPQITAENFEVSEVRQKVLIEVNENGTGEVRANRASSSTSSIKETRVFSADHPFYFSIESSKAGRPYILFQGRLSTIGETEETTIES